MPHGPGIDEGEELIQELKSVGAIRSIKVPAGRHKAEEYHLSDKESPGESLPEAAKDAIKEAVDLVKSQTAGVASETVHKFSRAWKNYPNGKVLDIYTDLLSDDEYQEGRRKAEYWRGIVAKTAGNQ